MFAQIGCVTVSLLLCFLWRNCYYKTVVNCLGFVLFCQPQSIAAFNMRRAESNYTREIVPGGDHFHGLKVELMNTPGQINNSYLK